MILSISRSLLGNIPRVSSSEIWIFSDFLHRFFENCSGIIWLIVKMFLFNPLKSDYFLLFFIFYVSELYSSVSETNKLFECVQSNRWINDEVIFNCSCRSVLAGDRTGWQHSEPLADQLISSRKLIRNNSAHWSGEIFPLNPERKEIFELFLVFNTFY